MERILLVEDEKALARFLELELSHEGYQVDIASDGRMGVTLALNESYDFILLDLMLPQLNGLEVCRRIRAEKKTPIIMLTARDTVMDRVMGLDSGADDYLGKPFAIEELFARMRGIKRRLDDAQPATPIEHKSKIHQLVDLQLQPESRLVTRAGKVIELSAREFDLLHYLFEQVNVVVSRDKLLNHVWGFDHLGETNVVDVYIRYLRSKIDDPSEVKLIQTVRGVGYVLRDLPKG